jgi:hypothetical protein
MIRRVLASTVIGTDDTPVTVRDHAGKGSKTGRLWAYLGDRDNPFVVYDYAPDRSAGGPERFLEGYRSGYLPSDAYAGYDGLHRRGLVAVGRWAHARRKFHECRTSDPERSHADVPPERWTIAFESSDTIALAPNFGPVITRVPLGLRLPPTLVQS